tara:strand:- start:1178 stop:1594 length:417 start_codon:yes stop_codon:yes gene_type:complete
MLIVHSDRVLRIAYIPLAVVLLAISTINQAQNETSKKLYEICCLKRKAQNLSVQKLDKELCQIADKWAKYLADNNRFHHGGGEQIIARGYSSPTAAINAWMNSQGHRRWLLCNRTHVGFGFAKSKNGHPYYVGVFRTK